MLRGYRGVLAAFAGIAALFTSAGFGAFYGSLYAPQQRHYQSVGANGGQTYPASSPKNGLADVSGIDALTQSILAKPQPRNPEEREQRDLAAQETSAVLAYWMFWAMIIQTALAGGALIALVKDLRQNRRSAEAQLRAYVLIESIIISNVELGKTPRVMLTFRNSGATVAEDVKMDLWFDLFPKDVDEKHLLPQHVEGTSKAPLAPGSANRGHYDLPRKLDQRLFSVFEKGEGDLICFGKLSYLALKTPVETGFRFICRSDRKDPDGSYVLNTAPRGNYAT